MNRREMLASAAAPFLLPSSKKREENSNYICGVGVFRVPSGDSARKIAHKLAKEIRQGSILILPSTRDEYGQYRWDFRIEGGDFDQVEVRRQNNDSHHS